MDSSAPLIFDHRRLAAHVERARRIGDPDSDFLSRIAAREIADRLQITLREFRQAADIYSVSPHMKEFLETERPGIVVESVPHDRYIANRDILVRESGNRDLAVSVFGLHWCNDLPGVLVQIARMLKPDGLFMAAIPGEGTLKELREAMVAAEATLTDGAAMRVDPFMDVRQAGTLLQRAGFSLPVCDVDEIVLRYEDVHALVSELRASAATSVMTQTRKNLPSQIMNRLELEYRSRFADEDGKIRVTVNIIYLTAWKPHGSQQKPLKRGSAKVRLADALRGGGSG